MVHYAKISVLEYDNFGMIFQLVFFLSETSIHPPTSSYLAFLEKKITLQPPRAHGMFFRTLDNFLMFYRGHITCLPPSTGSWTPVIKDAASEARNAMAAATSFASPARPRACVVLERSKNCNKIKRTLHQRNGTYFNDFVWWYLYYYRSIGALSAKSCPHKSVPTNLSSKFDEFLAGRSQFDTDHSVDFYAHTCCQSATFGPLFAFYCPLFLRKQIIKMSQFATEAIFTLQFSRRCRHRLD